MRFSKKIELNEMKFDDVSTKQNLTEEDFEQVLKNDNKKIELYSDEYVYINIMETFVKEKKQLETDLLDLEKKYDNEINGKASVESTGSW